MDTKQAQTYKQYVTATPTLYEIDFLPDGKGKTKQRTVFLDDSYIISHTGPRGSGKSLSLAYGGISALIQGLPVWSNFPIKFYVIRLNKQREYLEANLLSFKDLFSLSPEIQGGLVIIDEYQEYASAYSFMTYQNRLLNAFWAQIRKNNLSFFYSTKKYRWVDTKTRDETDIEINCMDAAKTPEGGSKFESGETIYWGIKDLSGLWTGYMFEEYPDIKPLTLKKANRIWGAFDTRFKIDFFQAIAGVKLDLQKTIISNREDGQRYQDAMASVQKVIDEMIEAGETKVRHRDLWLSAGIEDIALKKKIGEGLRNYGIESKKPDDWYYYFDNMIKPPPLGGKAE